MPRILFGAGWFELVNPRSWYERDYESVVLSHAPLLFNRWVCAPFKADVRGDDGTVRRPDLALVDTHYRTWCVVEIELSHHSFESHVLPQVEVFKSGTYGTAHARALWRARPDLDFRRLLDMMRGTPPSVLVVVDSPSTGWRRPLHERGISLTIAEPFRDAHNRLILRTNGDQLEPPAETLTRCSRYAKLARLWRVHSPAALPTVSDGKFEIEYDGIVTAWNRVDLQDAVMLHAARGDVLADSKVVDLVEREDKSLAFVQVARQTRSRTT